MRFFKTILKVPVWVYQYVLSPIKPATCRYSPTCSQYMVEAIDEWGLKGVWMGIKRIGRCHPWGGCGFDPVPQNKENKKGIE